MLRAIPFLLFAWIVSIEAQSFYSPSLKCGVGLGVTKNGTPLKCDMTLVFSSQANANAVENQVTGFQVVSDGCTHYSDAACPSKASAITRVCNSDANGAVTCTYSFTWTSPPALGGNLFTVYVLWNARTDYIVAQTSVSTSAAIRAMSMSWVSVLLAGLVYFFVLLL